ncbi:MAG TPA: imelysin family protein [Polyangia bacterium]|jgi:iron uptake system component EfeO|nr:imelysin family protein [Polyangia bacterium]
MPLPALALLAGAALPLPACESADTPKSDAQLQAEIVSNMHRLIMDQLDKLSVAARDLQMAAPATVAGGWDSSPAASAALSAMQQAWGDTRLAWESVEGTVAPLFPAVDDSMDARYEDMVAAGVGDAAPFDAEGATGMHAIERILFAPSPDSVEAYESTLPGYWPASWPSTDEDAAQLKGGLFQKLVDDSKWLGDQWKPLPIDLKVVFMGLTGLIASQAEKVSLAAQHQEESRYSGTTLADMRSNLKGTRAIYELFIPWLDTKPYGMTFNQNAIDAFDLLDRIYGSIAGDSVPAPPPSWGSVSPPSPADLQTPFGMLYTTVLQAVDKDRPGSAVDAMNHVARALDLSPDMS